MSRISIIPAKPSVFETLQGHGATLVTSSPRERAELLDGTNWSHRLSWKEEEGIGFYLQYFSLPPGTIVFREGDSAPFASIIVDGTLEIRKGDSALHDRVVARLTRGKMVGEMSLIDGQHRSATAVSVETTTILVLTLDDFNAMIEQRPDLALKYTMMVAEAIAQLLRQTTGLLVDHLDTAAHPSA
ncbi:MAG: cyclic nucleotide-binding domain-containing protein [Gemmatimonadota bacterium]